MAWDDLDTGSLISDTVWDDMVDDQKNHSGRHESGGSDEISLDGLTAGDDSNINFGSDSDFQLRFDSGNERLELYDNENDVDVFRVTASGAFTLRNRNLDLSDNSIVEVDEVDGVDVSSHGSRHESGGDDEVDHDQLVGYNSDEHVDHTSVSIDTGDGLTGGGDISSDRTLDIDISGETSVSPESDDELLVADDSDSDSIKKTTAQEVADLGGGASVSDDDSEVVAEPDDINFGDNLDVSDDGDDTVTVDFSGTVGHSVSDDGSEVVGEATDVNFGTALSVSDDGDGTVTVDNEAGGRTVETISDDYTTDGEDLIILELDVQDFELDSNDWKFGESSVGGDTTRFAIANNGLAYSTGDGGDVAVTDIDEEDGYSSEISNNALPCLDAHNTGDAYTAEGFDASDLYRVSPNDSEDGVETVWTESGPANIWNCCAVDENRGIVAYGSFNDYVTFRDISDGSELTSVNQSGSFSAAGYDRKDGYVYMGTESGDLYKYEAKDKDTVGDEEWNTSIGSSEIKQIDVDADGNPYLTIDGEGKKLDPSDGSVEWTYSDTIAATSVATQNTNKVYFTGNNNDESDTTTIVEVDSSGNEQSDSYNSGISQTGDVDSEVAISNNGFYLIFGPETGSSQGEYIEAPIVQPNITLSSSDVSEDEVITIKGNNRLESFNSTIDTEGIELIDGSETFSMDANDESIRLESDGTNWFITSRYLPQ